MLYQSKTSLEPIPSTINILLLIAFSGIVATGFQTFMVLFQGDILCLNEGCEIVENLTTVPPLVFNVAGLVYFFMIFWLLWLGKNRDRGMLKFVRLLLLCGLAAEGVLVSFQYWVAEVFCSYCLIILAFIVLLNLFMGFRQVFAGIAFFSVVALAFASLEFTSRSESGDISLANGTYGRLIGEYGDIEHFFFFSSTCPHCEEVIATLDDELTCNLNFNPIVNLAEQPLSNIEVSPKFDPNVNVRFLKGLGVQEIPALMVRTNNELRLLKGKNSILQYLDTMCRGETSEPVPSLESSEMTEMSSQSSSFQYLAPAADEEGCSIDLDCEEPAPEANQQ